jgi:hypothetical protein
LTDEAWQLAKHGLRKCVSIGFQPLEYEPLKDGGLRFTRWSWYELSLVSVPANSDAVIETVKRGPRRPGVIQLDPVALAAGKIRAEADARAQRREALGLKALHRRVELDPVEMALARARARRAGRR